MKKMYRIILICMISFILTGCGVSLREINLADLKNDAGDYQYDGLVWTSNVEDVENILNISFNESYLNPGTGHGQIEICQLQDVYAWKQVPASVICEFENAGLNCVTFRFTPSTENVENFWNDITAELISHYGSVEPESQSSNSTIETQQITAQRITYFWEQPGTLHTALSISKVSISGGTPVVNLSVYVIPSEKAEGQ